MKVSVCITVYNEEKSIERLLLALAGQSKKADEIVVVDGGSADQTVTLVRHLQKKNKQIRLLVEKCTRARGRNLSVELAKNAVIAMTDADCVPKRTWLERISKPFANPEIDIVAGFYTMVAKTPFQKAEAVFLGVMPGDFDVSFLPSTRSIAFQKSAWEKVGGFPERKENSAEDTDFNFLAVKSGLKFARVKNAEVEWGIPKELGDYAKKAYSYARWDGAYGTFWHPAKRLSSHNIKAILKIARIVIGLLLFVYGFYNFIFWILLVVALLTYFSWSFMKVFRYYGDIASGVWGVYLQLLSDILVSGGLLTGLATRLWGSVASPKKIK